MIVFGGTIAATLLTFPLKDIITAFKSAAFVFGTNKQRPEQLIQTMLQLTQLSRRKGLLALSEVKTNSPFLKRACNLIADASDEQMIRHVLRTEINSMKARHFNVQDVFKKMATYAPAFGMLGTLIGLIQMLSTLDDPSTIGPSMAVALLTTFYGSLLATVIFIPIAGKLGGHVQCLKSLIWKLCLKGQFVFSKTIINCLSMKNYPPIYPEISGLQWVALKNPARRRVSLW